MQICRDFFPDKRFFFASGGDFPWYPKIFYSINYIMILQRLRVIVGDSNPVPLPQYSGGLPITTTYARKK